MLTKLSNLSIWAITSLLVLSITSCGLFGWGKSKSPEITSFKVDQEAAFTTNGEDYQILRSSARGETYTKLLWSVKGEEPVTLTLSADALGLSADVTGKDTIILSSTAELNDDIRKEDFHLLESLKNLGVGNVTFTLSAQGQDNSDSREINLLCCQDGVPTFDDM